MTEERVLRPETPDASDEKAERFYPNKIGRLFLVSLEDVKALVMGVKAGLDPDTVLEVVNTITGRSGASLDKFPRHVLTRTFDFGSPIEIMYKDVSLAVEMAEKLGVPAFVGAMVKQMWGYAMSRGRAKEDLSTIIKSFEEWVGVEVRGKAASERAGQPE